MTILSPDKKVDPSHQYSHAEGHPDHQRHYFRDQLGNYVRYTNAPGGHKDATSHQGEAQLHPNEPSAAANKEYFTPDGRKLTRSPPPATVVQWNANYHPQDPQNLWAGRWVNPDSGGHEYAYIDADIRENPKLYVHYQNALVDVRLPVMRQYIFDLYNSPNVKDQIVAMTLALVDQGHFTAEALTSLLPTEVKQVGALIKFGNRWVFADHKMQSTVTMLLRSHHPASPFFAVPVVKKKGDIDDSLIRRIGPHYIARIFDQLGVSLQALQTYHATQVLSREVHRLLGEHQVPWETALQHGLLCVAQEMGYDLSVEPDQQTALQLIIELLVDPILVETLQASAESMGLLGQEPTVVPAPPPAVVPVSMDLTARTVAEEEFSQWLHTHPIHEHSEAPPSPMGGPNGAAA